MANYKLVSDSHQEGGSNPDEAFLNKEIEAENRLIENELRRSEEHVKVQRARNEPLMATVGLDNQKTGEQMRDARTRSEDVLLESERLLQKPSLDIEAMHKQDLDLAKANAERMESPGNPHWQGFIWNSSYGGYWWSRNGEAEETPSCTFNIAADRFDPKAQAWGEGWYDGDYSRIDAYLAFKFTPPSWGHLHIQTKPWFHGYYSLYSDDEWYNSEFAKAEMHSWVGVHQNFWRPTDATRRFALSGQEIHPTRAGRIDRQYHHSYTTNVGAGDPVTIRVGARLYDEARASGSHSKLNFQTGAGNYIYVPYVYWYLHH